MFLNVVHSSPPSLLNQFKVQFIINFRDVYLNFKVPTMEVLDSSLKVNGIHIIKFNLLLEGVYVSRKENIRKFEH